MAARVTNKNTKEGCELSKIPCLVPLERFVESGAKVLEEHSSIGLLFPHGNIWAKQGKDKDRGTAPTLAPSETKTTTEPDATWETEEKTMQPESVSDAKAWVAKVIECGKDTGLEMKDTHKGGQPDIVIVRSGSKDNPSPDEALLLIELKRNGATKQNLKDSVKGQVQRYALSFFEKNPVACKRLSVVINATDLFVVFAERGTKTNTFKKLFISNPLKLRSDDGDHGPGAKLLAGLLTTEAAEIERQFVTNVPALYRDTKKYKLEPIGRGAQASVFRVTRLVKPQGKQSRLKMVPEASPPAGEVEESDADGTVALHNEVKVLKAFMGTSARDALRSKTLALRDVRILHYLYGDDCAEAVKPPKELPTESFHALTMPFMGTPLRTAVRGSDSLPPGDVLMSALADMIDVVKKLHTWRPFGFVHCDIRPSNILFRRTDDKLELRLIDFGGVRHADEETPILPGDVFGVTFASNNILKVLAEKEPYIQCTPADDLVSIVRVAEAITTSRGSMPWDRDIQEHARLMLEAYKARPIAIPSLQDAMRAALENNHDGVKKSLVEYAGELKKAFADTPASV